MDPTASERDLREPRSAMALYAAAIFEQVPDGILLTTLDGTILASNGAARRLFERTNAELEAEARTGLVVMNDAVYEFLARRRNDGSARGIVTLRRKDGTTFLADVTSTVFAGPEGESWATFCIRDVTDLERARRALEVLARAGRTLARASLDPQATLDALTSLVVPELADVCTVDVLHEDGTVSRAALAHRDPSHVTAFRAVRKRMLNERTTSGADYVMRTGEPSWVTTVTEDWLRGATVDEAHFLSALELGVRSFLSVPLVVGGRTTGALTLMSDGQAPSFDEGDLSLVRALGDLAATALDNARRHAEVVDARELRDQVLAVVAHDLRSPLGVIQLANTMIASPGKRDENEMIARALRRANTLVQDLLLASKADAATLPLDLAEEGMASILDEVHAIHAPLALAKHVTFDVGVEGDGELARVVVDRHRIVQMLSNVVANAVDLTPPNGRVELRARSLAGAVELDVSDTGPGIPRDELPHVFDRFWQGARRRRAGAGLGLMIARAVALSHHGEITVTSTVGKGTTFRIVIPRRPPASVTPP